MSNNHNSSSDIFYLNRHAFPVQYIASLKVSFSNTESFIHCPAAHVCHSNHEKKTTVQSLIIQFLLFLQENFDFLLPKQQTDL